MEEKVKYEKYKEVKDKVLKVLTNTYSLARSSSAGFYFLHPKCREAKADNGSL